MASRTVFISYSRTDSDDVRDAVDLLRAGGVKVFVDVVNIDFGERWKDVLFKALDRCERVMVFWSKAAATSEWVEREWRLALELGKKIVPTLLDKTPLPMELAEFQAVRHRGQTRAGSQFHPATPLPSDDFLLPPPPARSSRSWIIAGAMALTLAGATSYVLMHSTSLPGNTTFPVTPDPPASAASSASSPASTPIHPPPPFNNAGNPGGVRFAPVMLIAVAGTFLVGLAYWYRRLRRRVPPEARAFVKAVFDA